MPDGPSYYETLTAAVHSFAAEGYVSDVQLEYWLNELRRAAECDLVSVDRLVQDIVRALDGQFLRLVDRASILRQHPGVSRFTLAQLRPALRDELNRRILASANLIKLHRDQAITETLRRFSGWATSVPADGAPEIARNPVKSEIRKSLARTPYEIRRVGNDQGHKLAANISAIIAQDSGAIAARWHHHFVRYPREKHVERDGKVYLVRNSWAHQQGLVRSGTAGYTDEITQPAEEVNCRCSFEWLTALRQLPSEMLTQKGEEVLREARRRIATKAA